MPKHKYSQFSNLATQLVVLAMALILGLVVAWVLDYWVFQDLSCNTDFSCLILYGS